MVRITWQDLMKEPAHTSRRGGIQGKNSRFRDKENRLFWKIRPISKFSWFGVDNYFLKFSILHNHQLDFPHPVKSNPPAKMAVKQTFCVLTNIRREGYNES